jgi:hypothetical protein
MNTLEAAYLIARNLTTRTQGKKHGSYLIYEDDKIQIAYDTYYPNLDIYIKTPEKKVLVMLRSGHGYNQEYHPGAWEQYVASLIPKALDAKQKAESEEIERKRAEERKSFGPVDDAAIFAVTP